MNKIASGNTKIISPLSMPVKHTERERRLLYYLRKYFFSNDGDYEDAEYYVNNELALPKVGAICKVWLPTSL